MEKEQRVPVGLWYKSGPSHLSRWIRRVRTSDSVSHCPDSTAPRLASAVVASSDIGFASTEATETVTKKRSRFLNNMIQRGRYPCAISTSFYTLDFCSDVWCSSAARRRISLDQVPVTGSVQESSAHLTEKQWQ